MAKLCVRNNRRDRHGTGSSPALLPLRTRRGRTVWARHALLGPVGKGEPTSGIAPPRSNVTSSKLVSVIADRERAFGSGPARDDGNVGQLSFSAPAGLGPRKAAAVPARQDGLCAVPERESPMSRPSFRAL